MLNYNIDITFGIPIFNSEKYIGEMLDCFSTSKDFKYEILIVNDGSTDNSVEICSKKRNSNIRIINQNNQGVSQARNKIIQEAHGKYLTFVDSDDLIHFDQYLKAYQIIEVEQSDLFIPSKKYELNELIEKEIINSPCMKIYNTKLLRDKKILFDKNISLGEDLLFNLKYYNICSKISFYNLDMYIYRSVNTNSLTQKYRKNKFEELMRVNEECKKMYNNKKIVNSLEYIRIKNNFSCLKSELINNRNGKDEIYRYIQKIRKYKIFRIKKLNTLKTSFIYYIWYLFPKYFLICLVKIRIRGNN